MGSSLSPQQATTLAVVAGALFFLFDAARHFVHQIGPVRLRRWSTGDPRGERWTRYSPRAFSLVTGVVLQISLVAAVAATAVAMRTRPDAPLSAATLWIVLILSWKAVLSIVPDAIAEYALRVLLPLSNTFQFLFAPFAYPFRKLFARREREDDDDEEEVTEEEVQAYIDVGEEEGILEGGEGKLVQSIVDFGDRVAKELMTPRIDVLAVEVGSTLEDIARIFSESKYSRIPVYQENIDKIIGIVHVKDAFEAYLRSDDRSVAELARPPYFVSESKSVADLLREFQTEHIQIAIVVDEYGGTSGIITIEDIVEEIVGEIADEHEDEEESIVEAGEGAYLVNGLVRVDSLGETLNAELSGDDYETVAGLIFTAMGRVPTVGEVVTRHGLRFEVERADRKRIYRVKVTRADEGDSERDEP